MKEFYISLIEDFRDIATEPGDETSAVYSESSVIKAPKYMQTAVKRGKKLYDIEPCCELAGLRHANKIQDGENLSLNSIKRMRSYASSLQANFSERKSKQAQAALLWGIPFSPTGLERYLKWCNTQIKKYD